MLTEIVRWQIGWLVGSMLGIVDGMSLGVELGGVVGINEGIANGTKMTGFGSRDETSLGCKDDDGFIVVVRCELGKSKNDGPRLGKELGWSPESSDGRLVGLSVQCLALLAVSLLVSSLEEWLG